MANIITYNIVLLDGFSSKAKKITRNVNKLKASVDKNAKSMQTFSQRIQKTSARLANFRTMMAAAAGAAALIFPIKKAAEFEDALVDVQRIVEFPGDSFDKYKESILQTSVYLGRIPKDIAAISYEAAKMEIPAKELAEFTKLIGMAAVAFDIPESEAGEMFASIKTKYGMSIDGIKDAMDEINYLSDHYALTSKKASLVLQRSFATFGAIEMNPKYAVGWSAFASMMILQPRKAATSLKMMVDRLRDVKKVPGFEKQLLESPQKALMAFFGALKGIEKVKRGKLIMDIFGRNAATFARVLVQRFDKLQEIMADIDSGIYKGSMLKELEIKLASTMSMMKKIRAVGDVALIGFGEAFLPFIKDIAPFIIDAGWALRDFLKANPMLVKMAVAALAIVTIMATLAVVVGVASAAFVMFASWPVAIAGGIIAVAAAIFSWYHSSDMVRQAIDFMIMAFSPIGDIISLVWDLGKELFKITGAGKALEVLFSGIVYWLTSSVLFFTTIIAAITLALYGMYDIAVWAWEAVTGKGFTDGFSDSKALNYIDKISKRIKKWTDAPRVRKLVLEEKIDDIERSDKFESMKAVRRQSIVSAMQANIRNTLTGELNVTTNQPGVRAVASNIEFRPSGRVGRMKE